MAIIATKLTDEQFIKLHGDNQFVQSFSTDAIVAILENIERFQTDLNKPSDVDWTEFFMAAGELSASDYIDEVEDDLANHSEALIGIASAIQFEDDDVMEALENDEGLDADELWREISSQLLNNSTFIQAAAEIMAEHNNLTRLDNGNWLRLDD